MTLRHAWKWLRSWFAASRVQRDVLSLESRCLQLRRECQLSKHELNDQRTLIAGLLDRMENEGIKAKLLIEKHEKAIVKLQNALDGSMEKLKIYEEITIPGLMRSIETMNAARDYQTAQFVMRQALLDARAKDGNNDDGFNESN